MRIRRIWMTVLAVCLCISLLPATASAAQSGDYQYRVTDGKAVITQYSGSEADVVVPATIDGHPVAGVAHNTFFNVASMRSLTFSEGIEWVDSYYAYGCRNLESISFPSTMRLASAGESSAWGYAVSAAVPDYCPAVRTITVAEGNENVVVYEGALYTRDMTALVYLPPADPRTVLEIPDTVRAIGDCACAYNENLREVVLPQQLQNIGYWAFDNCNNLERADLPSGVKFIGQYAFHQTALKSIHIPASLIMAVAPFYTRYNLAEDPGLSSLTVEEGNANFYAVDDVLYQRYADGDVLVTYAPGKPDAVFTVPEQVIALAYNSFSYSRNLEEAVLPDGLRSIEESAFSHSSLNRVEIPDSVTQMGGSVFMNCSDLEFARLSAGLKTVNRSTFAGCENLREAIVPEGVEILSDNVFFSCVNLENAALPDSLREIGSRVFSDCWSLKELVIPAGVEKLGSNMLYRCTGLETVTFLGDAPWFDGNAFANYTGTVVYNPAREGWAETVQQSYGGQIAWVAEVPEQAEPVFGDLNDDGTVDADDAIHLLYHTLFGEAYPVSGDCDFDHSGSVDADDAIYLLYHTLFGGAVYPLS